MKPRVRPARALFLAACLTAAGVAFLLAEPPAARGEDPGAAALAAAVKRGAALWKRSWRPGAKGCFACHTRGPNRMTAKRLKSYPKYDKALRRVVTVQEKLNLMIRAKSGGKPYDLGHADLTALEAYVSTLR